MTLAAPYPADTRAKGWRFELDYEKIDQSDTWGLAAEVPLARPCLVMMWLVAWTQEPCGSLPNDESIIRVRCGIPPNVWPKVRELLMRGWWQADDGRLYHDTVALRVLEMIEYRRKEAERRGRNRGKPPEVPPLSRGTDAGQQPQSHETPDTGTGTGTNSPSENKTPRKRAAASPPPNRPDDVPEQVWGDWLQLRKKKSAPVTETVLSEAITEAAKAGLPLKRFLAIWCARGSQGLQADWLKPHETAGAKRLDEPAWRTEQRERTQQAAPGVAVGGAVQFFEAEVKNVTPIALG